jgi:hypothetical protein
VSSAVNWMCFETMDLYLNQWLGRLGTDSAPGESPGSATLPFVKLLNRHGYVKTSAADP